jgi:DNA-binding NtrC family response regulator
MNADTPKIPFPGQGQNNPKKQRLLIVDDEPAILFAYQKLFEREGYLVDLCETPDLSMQMIKTHLYFAIISDMRFGGTDNEDGIDILHSIRKHQPETKVILVSGNAGAVSKQTWLNLGVSHFFSKPVLPELLLSALKDAE